MAAIGPGVVAVGPGVVAIGAKVTVLEPAPGIAAVEPAPNVTAAATWVIGVGHWAAGPQAIRNGSATVHE